MISSRTGLSRYIPFKREEWAQLRAATPLPLTETELQALRGLNEQVSLREVEEVYLPLSRLLNLYATAAQNLFEVTDRFLGKPVGRVPYVIAIAGSVAVGKSTTARILQALLARWPHHPKVDLITTDGFLFPNETLEARGLLARKGFPESYDRRQLVQFLGAVKSGRSEVTAPVYSHQSYDIISGQHQTVRSPDIVILEGLNVLQTGAAPGAVPTLFVSDFIDFSIYVDADELHIEEWYVERFLTLRDTVFRDPGSYFHRYTHLSVEEAIQTAREIWSAINGVNLRENIQPTRERAHLILRKGADHSVRNVWLRKI